jgi:hypothetical protein
VVELIGATTTKTGLKVESALDTRTYQKGIEVRKAEMKCLDITGDQFHPECSRPNCRTIWCSSAPSLRIARRPTAKAFIAYLKTPEAAAVFKAKGVKPG